MAGALPFESLFPVPRELKRKQRIQKFLELEGILGPSMPWDVDCKTVDPGQLSFIDADDPARKKQLARIFDRNDDLQVDEDYKLTEAEIQLRRHITEASELYPGDLVPGMMLWHDVAGGLPRDNCGKFKSRRARCSSGRPECDVVHFKDGCWDYECPIDYKRVCAREAKRITEKIKGIRTSYANKGVSSLGRVYHDVFGVPESLYPMFNTRQGLDEIYRVLKRNFKLMGIVGAVVIPHRHRKTHGNDDSWHFHCLVVLPRGQQLTTKEFEEKTGWTYINLGKRKSVFGTAFYQLTHADVPNYIKEDGKLGRLQMVRYFGIFGNHASKKELKEIVTEPCKCSVCGLDMIQEIDLTGDNSFTDAQEVEPWFLRKKVYRFKLRSVRVDEQGNVKVIDYFARFLKKWGALMDSPYKRIDIEDSTGGHKDGI